HCAHRVIGSFPDCYCDQRDLHSFPTRRSSDLIAGKFALLLPGKAQTRSERQEKNQPQRSRCFRQNSVHGLGGILQPATNSAESRDRKSTRLNSSHVAISYAVFCLKKQKCMLSV